MGETIYDRHADFYIDFVDAALVDRKNLWHVLVDAFEKLLQGRLAGARVCDIACGEGYLSRLLGKIGPEIVIGIDISAALIEAANKRCDADNLSYRVDDAQVLGTFADCSVDIAVSQMAIMDIVDHRALFRSVRRILVPGGTFAFSMLHPCFETPYRSPSESQYLLDEAGRHVAVVARRYASEGFWQSGGAGVRGHMGAHHRMLSTLLNDLISSGFLLERLEEPVLADLGLFAEIPRNLVVSARAV